jgi:hypothetical protein
VVRAARIAHLVQSMFNPGLDVHMQLSEEWLPARSQVADVHVMKTPALAAETNWVRPKV